MDIVRAALVLPAAPVILNQDQEMVNPLRSP
jgi:hypothetical protein